MIKKPNVNIACVNCVKRDVCTVLQPEICTIASQIAAILNTSLVDEVTVDVKCSRYVYDDKCRGTLNTNRR